MRGFILNATSIKVNWTTSSETNGYVIEYTTGGVTRNVSTSEDEIVLTNLSPMSTYTISVYSYIDLPSVNSTIVIINCKLVILCLYMTINFSSSWSSWFSIQYHGHYMGCYLMECT